MNSRTIDTYITIPDSFDELNEELWLLLLILRHRLIHDKGVTLTDVRRTMARKMLEQAGLRHNVRFGLWMKKESYLLLIDQVADSLDWMITFDPVTETVVVPLDTTKQLLPQYKTLLGPMSHAEDLTFGEFHAAVAAMNDYTTTHNPQSLLALTAILYRKTVYDEGRGYIRTPFHTDRIPWLMNDAKHVEENVQWGIYAWFAHLCEHIRTGEFNIMGSTVCFAPLFARSEDDEPSDSSLGMNGILLSVAESGVFGDADKVMQTPLLRVLMKLLSDHEAAERIKRDMKQHQS